MKTHRSYEEIPEDCPFLQSRLAEAESLERARACIAGHCRWFERRACRFAQLCARSTAPVSAA